MESLSYKSLVEINFQIGLITTKEEKKGVELITGYNSEHQLITDFYLEKSERPSGPRPTDGNSSGRKILEGYIIMPSTAQFFKNFGLQKGQVVQTADIRKYVTDYVKNHNLQDQENGR